MRAALPCLACLLALSGCLGGGDPPQAVADLEPAGAAKAGAPDDVTQARSASFGWAAAAGASAGQDVQALSASEVPFDVEDGRRVLTANATWDCLTPTCGLHAWLCSPDEWDAASGGDPLAPPSCEVHEVGAGPFAFRVDEPMAGEWVLALMSEAPSADVSGTIEFYAA